MSAEDHLLRAFAQAPTLVPSFDDFTREFDRSYAPDSEEYALRRSHYEERAEVAQQQNDDPSRLWTAGVNHLWDLTHEEFKGMLGYRRQARPVGGSSSFLEVSVQDEGDLMMESGKHRSHLRRMTDQVEW